VRVRNLSILGITTGSTGILGTTMGALCENVVNTGFNAGNAAGIRFQPTNASAKLFVMDSIMDHNGISTTTGGGIVIVPGAAGSANVQIMNTRLVDNSVGLNLFSSGGMLVAVHGGMVATNHGDGIRAIATAVLNLLIAGTSVVNNFGTGVLASGAAATVLIGGATISGNATGVSFAGAAMQSFKNNQIAGNNTDGTPKHRRDADPALFRPWRHSSAVAQIKGFSHRPSGEALTNSISSVLGPRGLTLGQDLGPDQHSAAPHCASAAERRGTTTLGCYLRRLRRLRPSAIFR
jgi:hypothetical protein